MVSGTFGPARLAAGGSTSKMLIHEQHTSQEQKFEISFDFVLATDVGVVYSTPSSSNSSRSLTIEGTITSQWGSTAGFGS